MSAIGNIITTPFRVLRAVMKGLLAIVLVTAVILAIINAYVWFSTKDRISNDASAVISASASNANSANASSASGANSANSSSLATNNASAPTSSTADAIIVPGAAVSPDGTPTTILRDRLNTALELYNAGAAPVILVSGASSIEGYCEAQAMAKYLVNCGVPESNIVRDFEGNSTYATMYRAKNSYHFDRVIIASQAYHLPRSIFCAQGVGLDARGVDSTLGHTYNDQTYYNVREVFSNVKAALEVITRPPANDTALTQQLASKFETASAY